MDDERDAEDTWDFEEQSVEHEVIAWNVDRTERGRILQSTRETDACDLFSYVLGGSGLCFITTLYQNPRLYYESILCSLQDITDPPLRVQVVELAHKTTWAPPPCRTTSNLPDINDVSNHLHMYAQC